MIEGFSHSSGWAEPMRTLLAQPELGPWLSLSTTKIILNEAGTVLTIHLQKPLTLYQIDRLRGAIYQLLVQEGHDISVMIQ